MNNNCDACERQPLFGDLKNEKFSASDVSFSKKKNGLSLFSTTVFIAGEMAGSGVLALPRAIVNTGRIGLLLLIFFCGNAAYGGKKLGDCWNMIEERYPEYRTKTRNPYSIIAEKAAGKCASSVVSHSIRFSLFGAGTVYLLLCSQIIQELLEDVLPIINSCSYFLLISICMILPMWLGSPKEFSFVGIGALLTTTVACILFFVQLVDDSKTRVPAEHSAHGFYDFFLSFGTLQFAFGGASTFPTIQNDMKDKRQFSTSVFIAFSVILMIYFPVTAGGFFVFGEEVTENLTASLTRTPLVIVGNILMAVHIIFAFLIIVNPVCQEIEESFKVPKYFNWKRCFIRSVLVLIMIIVGEFIPKFGKILALVGGSTVTLLTFVCPPYFYLQLSSQEGPHWTKRHIPLHEKIYIWELIFIGIIGGCAATYSAVIAIFENNSFTEPCLWKS